MSALKRLCSKSPRFIVALEDARDPMEEYIRALGSRGERLERDVGRLETQLHAPQQ